MPPSNETTTSVFIRGFKCGLVWSILLNSKANCFCASELSIKKYFCESLEVFCKNWCLAKTYSAVQILLFYNWVKNFWRITVKKLLFPKHFEQNSPVSQYLFQTIFCANRQPKYCLVILHLVNFIKLWGNMRVLSLPEFEQQDKDNTSIKILLTWWLKRCTYHTVRGCI